MVSLSMPVTMHTPAGKKLSQVTFQTQKNMNLWVIKKCVGFGIKNKTSWSYMCSDFDFIP